MQRYILYLLFMLAVSTSLAEEYNDHSDFAEYSVYYTLLSSTFIQPEVAANYGIKRSKYENLINVSISRRGEYGALPGRVEGTVTNLLQQQKKLNFLEIREKTATYYIAPVRISGEEVVHFELSVIPDGEYEALKMKFSKKIYSDP